MPLSNLPPNVPADSAHGFYYGWIDNTLMYSLNPLDFVKEDPKKFHFSKEAAINFLITGVYTENQSLVTNVYFNKGFVSKNFNQVQDEKKNRYLKIKFLKTPHSEFIEKGVKMLDDEISRFSNTGVKTGIMLSSGYDSGAIFTSALKSLKNIETFTHIPIRKSNYSVEKDRYGDEEPLTRKLLEYHNFKNYHFHDSSEVNPLENIRSLIRLGLEPTYAMVNLHWLINLYKQAKNAGCDQILDGWGGNATLSWTGLPTNLKLIRHLTAKRFRFIKHQKALNQISPISPKLLKSKQSYLINSSIGLHSINRPLHYYRLSTIGQNTTHRPLNYSLIERILGINIRLPLISEKVINYCLGVSEHYFATEGKDKLLIREGLKHRFPVENLVNSKKGYQAADVADRFEVKEINDGLKQMLETSELKNHIVNHGNIYDKENSLELNSRLRLFAVCYFESTIKNLSGN